MKKILQKLFGRSGPSTDDLRFRVFYCDYEQGINRKDRDGEYLSRPEIVQLMRAVLRSDGNFLGLIDRNDLTLQFMTEVDGRITIDVPVPKLGGSYSKIESLDYACNVVKQLSESLEDAIASDMVFSGPVQDHELFKNGRSKLHYLSSDVALGQWEKRLDEIVNAGISIDQQDEEGFTALHMAVFSGHVVLVELLLEAGASPNLVDDSGRNSIWWALDRFEGDPSLVQRLLSAGADLSAEDVEGVRPLDIARSHADPSLAFIVENGTIQ